MSTSVIHDELEAAQMREMLTFRLGSEAYGINILKVQEIRGCDPVTPIAGTPEFIRGVIDLRGVIVPIVDMRMKFSLSESKYDAFTVVIILNVSRRVIGIVVDAVSDVVTFDKDQIRPVPEFSTALDTQFIMGLARLEEHMVILLDIEHLLSSPEMQLTDAATAAMSAAA
jgi:purine-binding chemotaxis protein CheW